MKRLEHISNSLLVVILSLFVICGISYAHFGEKYEPVDGRVIHGLGQYVSIGYTDAENWQYVTEYQDSTGFVPVIYSAYAYLDPNLDQQDYTDLNDIAHNHGYPYILAIGLVLADSTSNLGGNINIPVTDILNGNLDYRIIDIAQRIKSLNTPVYFRPGFEFGSGNSGLHNDDDNPQWNASNFKLIWQRIYSIFANQGVNNVAWVWNTVNPSSFSFMDWYPGDEYVDWFGINYFTSSQINGGDAFLDSAAAHQKPVMICESNPIQNGGTTNAANWTNWFVPYFNKIAAYPHIKAFIYISDPWDKPEFFGDWPDSRIYSNSTILANYKNELNNSKYIHMDDYQAAPWLVDITLPVSLVDFRVEALQGANLIYWQTASEINNLGFNIYRAQSDQIVPESQLSFSRINFELIQGAGNSSTLKNYSYRDENVEDNRYYWYQLEDVDFNGRANRHLITMVYRSGNYVKDIHLYPNYPNPFNSGTFFKIFLPERLPVQFSVYNLVGQKIFTQDMGWVEAGYFIYHWKGVSNNRWILPSGSYFYNFYVGGENFSGKLTIVR